MRKVFFVLIAMLLVAGPVLAAEVPEIKRAVLCTSVTDREPANPVEAITTGEQIVFFFNEITNASGSSITHRWLYNDIEIANVPLKIGADRWRTWSSKQVWHLMPGILKVQVLDETGKVLNEQTLKIDSKAS